MKEFNYHPSEEDKHIYKMVSIPYDKNDLSKGIEKAIEEIAGTLENQKAFNQASKEFE